MKFPVSSLFAFFSSCSVFLSIPVARAQGSPACPPVVSRQAWGARTPKSDISKWADYGLEKPVYTDVVLHVTAMGRGRGVEEAKRIQNKQMDDLGFSDIAYNFLIDEDGTIFEGRLLSFVPGHAGQTEEGNRSADIRLDPDYGAIGISFSSGSSDQLTRGQIDSAKALIRFWKGHPKFNIQNVYTHAEVKARMSDRGLHPLGEYNVHVCPGEGALEDLVQLRRDLKTEFGIPFDEKEYRKLYESK